MFEFESSQTTLFDSGLSSALTNSTNNSITSGSPPTAFSSNYIDRPDALFSSLYSGDNSTSSVVSSSDFNSLLFDTASLTERLTGQPVKQQEQLNSLDSSRMSIARPTSFSTLFGSNTGATPSSPIGESMSDFLINPLGAPGTPIGNSQMSTPNGGTTQTQPAKNPKLYKTELCRSWMDHGRCNYGERCQYAHGEDEKRPVPRHPKYKTEACQSFHQSGYCPYGPRCHFIHNDNQSSQPTTPVTVNGQPSLYVSQYHNMSMKQQQQQQQTPQQSVQGVPSNVLQRVYSLPNGGYGSAGESPAGSSNDSGSESPNGSFSPGLDVDEIGSFSAYSTTSPIKKQQPARFLSYDHQTSFADHQFSHLLNDLCTWNLEDSLSSVLNSQKWSSEDYSTSTPAQTSSSTTSNIGSRLPVFAQLSNPQ